MANSEHIKILNQGVNVWNRWRVENPEIIPNLNGFYLNTCESFNRRGRNNISHLKDLNGIDFSYTQLKRSNFKCVDLSNASFIGADILESEFSHCKFFNSLFSLNCKRCRFLDCDIVDCDFEGTNFSHSNFQGTNFTGSDLSWTNCFMVNFSGVTLVNVKFYWANCSMSLFSNAEFNDCQIHGTNFTSCILSDIRMSNVDSVGANFTNTNLTGCYINNSNFTGANFTNADLKRSIFKGCDLFMAILRKTNLSNSNLSEANLTGVDLTNAIILDADLTNAILVRANLSYANMCRSNVFGISAWDVLTHETIQKDMIITPANEPEITVDDIEVAQFTYLMLNNKKIRNIIETITSKAVLILGRFSPEQKTILDMLKEELRRRNYLPIVFDFQNAVGKVVHDTVRVLSGMSRFVIADITDAHDVRSELSIVVSYPSVPVVLLIKKGQKPYHSLDDILMRDTVLGPPYEYDTKDNVFEDLNLHVVYPAEQKVEYLRNKQNLILSYLKK
jgi:uncharacterized protein YjbI with pentapeptide repeats